MLLDRLDISEDEIVTIFNQLFQGDLNARDYPAGMKKTTIHSQYSRSNREKCPAWKEVEQTPEKELTYLTRAIEKLRGGSTNRASNSRLNLSDSLSRTAVSVVTQTKETLVQRELRPCETFEKFPKDTAVSADGTRAVNEQQEPVVQAKNQRKSRAGNTAISASRTRTVSGQQKPIIQATDPVYVPLSPVAAQEAHHSVPELLFRAYSDESQGVVTPSGIIAGSFSFSTIGPSSPPDCSCPRLYGDILQHLNNNEIFSPVISTSSNLFFVIRRAAKQDPSVNPRICVIRGSTLPPEKVFHARPYHVRFKKEKSYLPGKDKNPANHEYLVWATIPQSAILCDFSFDEFERKVTTIPSMQKALRINQMRSRTGNARLQRQFRRNQIFLKSDLAVGLARILALFSIDVKAPASIAARLISELIRGWEICLLKTSKERWNLLAATFACAFSDDVEPNALCDGDLIRAKKAFLTGLQIGLGEINWHLDPQRQKRMHRRIAQFGLGDHSTTISQTSLAYDVIQIDDTDVEETDTEMESVTSSDSETEVVSTVKVQRQVQGRSKRYRQPSNNFGNLIIYDRSDDEDYVMMEAENSDLEYQHPRGGRHNSREHVLLKDWQFQF